MSSEQPKEYIIDKNILDSIEEGVDGEWGEGVFAKYWGGDAIRSRPHPAPASSQQRIEQFDLLELQRMKIIVERNGIDKLDVPERRVLWKINEAIALLQAGEP